MDPNGEQSSTPRRWRLTIWWKPTRPGIDGLEQIAGPIRAFLRWLDRDGGMHVVVRPDRVDDWPCDDVRLVDEDE